MSSLPCACFPLLQCSGSSWLSNACTLSLGQFYPIWVFAEGSLSRSLGIQWTAGTPAGAPPPPPLCESKSPCQSGCCFRSFRNHLLFLPLRNTPPYQGNGRCCFRQILELWCCSRPRGGGEGGYPIFRRPAAKGCWGHRSGWG